MMRQPKGKVLRTKSDDPVLRAFLNDIAKYPVLPQAEQSALAAKAKAGDTAARQRLLESNYRLLARIAFEYGGKHVNDLIQEGFVGLDMAIDKYDPAKGTTFPNYAAWWIRMRIIKWLRLAKTIHIPETQTSAINRLTDATVKYMAEHGSVPSESELAGLSGLSEFMVHNFCEWFDRDTPKGHIPLKDVPERMLPEDTSPSPEENADKSLLKDTVEQCLRTLPEDQQEFLRDYYGIGRTAVPVSRMAEESGTTRENIRQKRMRILSALQKKCGEMLRPFADEIDF